MGSAEDNQATITQTGRVNNASLEAYITQGVELIYERLWTERDRRALDAYRNGGRASGGSFALVSQFGNQNTAAVNQAGPSNLAVLYQKGDGNTSLLEQVGTGNLFGSYLTGSGNATDVVQRGTGNIYVLDFVGDGLEHTARQLGSNNQAVQTGRGAVPFNVEQRGDDMQLIIRHNQ